MVEKSTRAVAYYRTSSAANVGAEKDSLTRQQEAVKSFARSHGYQIETEFYDAAISGADPLRGRPGFEKMLHKLLSNGARTIIVENASRFARDVVVQETGVQLLKEKGVTVIPADDPHYFSGTSPSQKMIRQILGVVAEFQKDALVEQLAVARRRKREATGRCEGRKPLAELHPEAAALAKRLRRRSPKTGKRRSLRAISAQLAAAGHLSSTGKPYSAKSILSLTDH